ncbi:Pre-mRNA-splicing factor of RES complex-domain-containing protein [Massariosphaeria phaeospora]|uniref:Pre-mRNA-splicing factor of RES complex-domain-containing protein n=1 Tax=Massariosphaeria phaeospora TaxID=100035 RepID=A0A7C8M2Z5_9PLEO|nr:Pre-mRNA-splicing factor of RES complex-domain-containing protein [Massariosphaeria phaeospora]
MSLADYLAKNYLTADSDKKTKKRKRKNKEGGLKIDDDDISGWNRDGDDDEDDGPTIAGMTTGVKKLKKKSRAVDTISWTTVGVAAPTHAQQLAADSAATADAIISSAAADRQQAADADDAAPTMVDTEGVLKMESGAHAGLQTAAQVAAATKKKQEAEQRKAADAAREMGAAATETIYRDASGRRIDIAKQREEARKAADAAALKKLELEKAARGDVQNAEAVRRKEKLQDAKTMTIARFADDEELNDELKGQGRWNDPAAGFLRSKKKGRSVTGKPLYTGGWQPNRYGIRPGHRWDGVDRGNGFEGEWFKSRNKKADTQKMQYAWQMDD